MTRCIHISFYLTMCTLSCSHHVSKNLILCGKLEGWRYCHHQVFPFAYAAQHLRKTASKYLKSIFCGTPLRFSCGQDHQESCKNGRQSYYYKGPPPSCMRPCTKAFSPLWRSITSQHFFMSTYGNRIHRSALFVKHTL